MPAASIDHIRVPNGDVDIHAAICGEGEPVVMCHGFPGLWYSWRHQLAALAAAGWKAVALDMRGYGQSSAPTEPSRYTHDQVATDVLAVLDHLGSEQAVLVGHDFGAPFVWSMALRHPERVKAVVALSVPYEPRRSPTRPSETFAAIAGQHFLHLDYFQEPGKAEAELDAHVRAFLTRLFWALSGAYRYSDIWARPPAGPGYLGVLPEPTRSPPWSWLSEAELDVYVEEFGRTGFRGGLNWYRAIDLNWYRAIDLNWENGSAWAGRKVEAPSLFLAGARDTVVEMSGPAALDLMRSHVPDLRGCHLIPDAGHWVQQEAPGRLNELLIDFLDTL